MSKVTVDFDRIEREWPPQERGLAVAYSVVGLFARGRIKSIFEQNAGDGRGAGEELEELCAELMERGTKFLNVHARKNPKLCAAGKRWLTAPLLRAWVFEQAEAMGKIDLSSEEGRGAGEA